MEDCAQSFGAHWKGRMTGTFGAFGTFSFFPTKNLSAVGDAGLLTTPDADLLARATMLRMHGSRRKYHNEAFGYNSRLDELQAALLRVKLPQVAAWNADRTATAERYGRQLADLPGLVPPSLCEGHAWHQYTVRIPGRRAEIQLGLAEAGIGSMVYYPVPCHRLPVYAEAFAEVRCPEAEKAAAEVLSLPLWPGMDPAIADRVCEVLRSLLG